MSEGKPAWNEDEVRRFTVAADDDGVRLDRWFKRHLPQVGFATISRWARTGQIRVDGKRAAPEDRLVAGQLLRIPPGSDHRSAAATGARKPRPRAPLSDEDRALAASMLMVETPAALVLNKPPGLATQGGTGTYAHVDGLLDAYAGETDPRPRLVHRLDKDTSGALLVARTPGSAAFFAKRFSGRSARKVYWALVIGVPSRDEGLVDLPIAKQPGTGGEKMYVDPVEGQPSRSRYRVIDRAGNRAAWVELQPLTGRTHQLRVHMAALGHPIVGDGKYGGAAAFLSGSISRKLHLHARRLKIEAPGGQTIDATAPLPEHFAASLAQLGFEEADGNVPLDAMGPNGGPPEPDRETLKQAARAHAKQVRKERRGERRQRGDAAPAKPAGKPKPKTARPGARPSAPAGRRGPPGARKPR